LASDKKSFKEELMSTNKTKVTEWLKSVSAYGGIAFFVIIALEVMIMISPFAFFFYSVFNPVFKWLNQYAITGWLTTFFLPHMILPPTLFLRTIRILGSVFFIIGAVTFFFCAFQVYFNKIFKRGAVVRGLYTYIRHPQYVALGIWGIGMAILWPRFFVLASLSLMFILYYFLAKNEERRMLGQYGETYAEYMNKTGMFFPGSIEKFLGKTMPATDIKYFLIPLVFIFLTLGTGFILRTVTLHQIPFENRNNVTLISILPEDNSHAVKVLNDISISEDKEGIGFLNSKKDYLCYLMPADYVMQGMIANTGSDFHLFKQSHTLSMITEWVLHPFGHLRASPALHMAKMHNVDPVFARRHHCPIGINKENLDCKVCSYRRVIFVQVDNNRGKHISGKGLLSFNTTREPVGFIDINVETGEIVSMKEVEKSTAWKDVPTPAI